MITLIVPTRNRAHTLRLVGETFYRQDGVSEVIFVDDAGSDDSPAVIAELAGRFPAIPTRVLRNGERRGAAFSRTLGFKTAANEYVLYCDDDVYLEPGYARTCLEKLEKTGAAIVSGRLVHKRASQSAEAAIEEFGYGSSRRAPFKKLFCEFRVEARFRGDLTSPLTHSVILTRKELLEKYGYDSFYAKGNGYREESDFQLNAFINGHTILVTNDTHCVELSRQENPSGGQRVGRLQRLFWNVYYTNYFYRKYYKRYAERLGLPVPRQVAIAAFAVYQLHMLFIRPWSKLPGRILDRLATSRRPAGGAAPLPNS
jgi:glycosyltransferase involved in cell wall biosynthesis